MICPKYLVEIRETGAFIDTGDPDYMPASLNMATSSLAGFGKGVDFNYSQGWKIARRFLTFSGNPASDTHKQDSFGKT